MVVITLKMKANVRKTMRFLFFGVVSIVVVVTIMSSLSGVIVDIYGKYKEKDLLNDKLLELKETEAKLTVDVERMNDPEYVGRYLREKFFYSKENEFIIRIPE